MRLSRSAKVVLGIVTALVLLFIYTPLLLVVVNSFNADRTFGWPPKGFTLEWWGKAFDSPGVREAVVSSLWVAVVSTIISLVLGTLLALSLQRYEFFGRDVINLLVILPIALPGVVTGIALNNMFTTILGVPLSLWTVVIAHATFCMVTVFNNAIARLRRTSAGLEEASADLGAGVFTTFGLVTFPQLRSALLAGGLLAFALSFDEIIVTTFTIGAGETTLPIWILQNLFRPNQAPVVNVVAVVLIVVSIVPIWLAQRLSGDSVRVSGARVKADSARRCPVPQGRSRRPPGIRGPGFPASRYRRRRRRRNGSARRAPASGAATAAGPVRKAAGSPGADCPLALQEDAELACEHRMGALLGQLDDGGVALEGAVAGDDVQVPDVAGGQCPRRVRVAGEPERPVLLQRVLGPVHAQQQQLAVNHGQHTVHPGEGGEGARLGDFGNADAPVPRALSCAVFAGGLQRARRVRDGAPLRGSPRRRCARGGL